MDVWSGVLLLQPSMSSARRDQYIDILLSTKDIRRCGNTVQYIPSIQPNLQSKHVSFISIVDCSKLWLIVLRAIPKVKMLHWDKKGDLESSLKRLCLGSVEYTLHKLSNSVITHATCDFSYRENLKMGIKSGMIKSRSACETGIKAFEENNMDVLFKGKWKSYWKNLS